MRTLREAAEEFLAAKRIGVAGVSRDSRQPANLIYRRLRASGHEVYAINPATDTVEDGDRCFPSVDAVPAELEGVVVVTPARACIDAVAECARAGVPRVWIHRGMGPGSSSEQAVVLAREHGIDVIPGGCPNMFGDCSDPGHRCMRAALSLTGRIPRHVARPERPLAAAPLSRTRAPAAS